MKYFVIIVGVVIISSSCEKESNERNEEPEVVEQSGGESEDTIYDPNARFRMSREDLTHHMVEASKGSAESSWQVYVHYARGICSMDLAFPWLIMAVNHQHPKACKEYLALQRIEAVDSLLRSVEHNAKRIAGDKPEE